MYLVDPRIERVIALIEENLRRSLSLDALARLAGLSSSRLRHKFKSEVGMTPTVYLQLVRMRKARELLNGHRLTVKEVRAAVGIKSDSYFAHQFKRFYGVRPSDQRTY
jgi:AraC-like DNA-binding protein